MVQIEAARVAEREVRLGDEDALPGEAVERLAVGDLDALDVLDVDAEDDRIRRRLAGELLEDEELLIGARAGDGVVVDLGAELLAHEVAEALVVLHAVARGERVAEEEDARLARALLGELHVGPESVAVRAHVEAAVLTGEAGLEVGEVQVPDLGVIADHHPMRGLLQEKHARVSRSFPWWRRVACQ
ncbi:MAG: hypothetical protein QM820_15140 [Minicystis sp.]